MRIVVQAKLISRNPYRVAFVSFESPTTSIDRARVFHGLLSFSSFDPGILLGRMRSYEVVLAERTFGSMSFGPPKVLR